MKNLTPFSLAQCVLWVHEYKNLARQTKGQESADAYDAADRWHDMAMDFNSRRCARFGIPSIFS